MGAMSTWTRVMVAAVCVALALVLGALVLSVAVLKFFRTHSFQTPLARAGEDV